MTVEAAIALGALVLVLAVVLAGMGATVVRLRCVDAAGEAARLAARGDPAAATRVQRLLPPGTEVEVAIEGDDVRVVVRAPPLGAALPGLRVGAQAWAAREPGSAAPATGADPPTEGVPDAAPSAGAPTPSAAPVDGAPPSAAAGAGP